MPNVFSRRNRSVHFALTLILIFLILALLFYNPEPDTDVDFFNTEDLSIKHQWTTPTPTATPVELPQRTPEVFRAKHPHSTQHIGYSTKSKPPSHRTCHRPYKVKKNDTINDITRIQNVATLDLLARNTLSFPHRDPLVEGTIICLPKTCLLAHIGNDRECRSLVDQGLVQPEILVWNPSAARGLQSGSLCHALEMKGGVYVCMSEPGKV